MVRRTGSCKVPVWSSVIMFLEFFSWIFCQRTTNCSLYILTFVQCLLLGMYCQLFISHCLMIMSLTFRCTHIYSRYLNYKCNYLRVLCHVLPTFRNQHTRPLYSHWKRRFHWLKYWNVGVKFGSTRHTVLKTSKVFTCFDKFPGKPHREN